ncbi:MULTISPECIES: molybdenum cofactor guanylyltransferase [Microbacterium]|uniref:NTP transferase domain-containing protein n=1 Tax=Microbacterium marmarense TaxID=3122051 RepID=A0ABU8LRZ4_9MICO
MTAAPALGAILLAGGRATRVDGASKPLFEVGGETLLRATCAAVLEAGARQIVVAGDVLDDALEVRWVREDPPFGGPAAGAVAAVESWSDETAPTWVFLLACDLPEVQAAVARLSEALPLLPDESDGACLADETSRPQWLIGIYRTRSLRRAASALPDRGQHATVRSLIDDLAITVLRAPAALTEDVDTWEDLAKARERVGHPTNPREETQ